MQNMANSHTKRVEAEHAGTRLDRFLADSLPDLSRSRLKALIVEGHVHQITPQGNVTLTEPSFKIKPDTDIVVTIPTPSKALPEAENITLNVIYEDNDLIVIDKPAGLVVHPAHGNETGTLVNALLHHCSDSLSGIGGVIRPGIVHRIDKDTSGLMVAAKNDATHAALSEMFAEHTIERVYLAVVHGIPPESGRIEGDLGRAPNDRKKMAIVERGGRHAVTHFKTLEVFTSRGQHYASLVECRLETGRTHQVRVHMASIGHPLVGDSIYDGGRAPSTNIYKPAYDAVKSFKRQALHAHVLGFTLPNKKPLYFVSELPNDIMGLVQTLRSATDV